MVKTILVENLKKIKKAVPKIEAKVKIRFSIGKNIVIIRGNELNEFIVEKIVHAVDFGFEVEDALLLLGQNHSLEFIDVKEHTRRKNLHDVRSRLIGTGGKVLNTLENLTGAILVVKNNKIGVISESKTLDGITQAIELIIRGAKHGNAYAFLERINRSRRRSGFSDEDLGLRDSVKKKYVDSLK